MGKCKLVYFCIFIPVLEQIKVFLYSNKSIQFPIFCFRLCWGFEVVYSKEIFLLDILTLRVDTELQT